MKKYMWLAITATLLLTTFLFIFLPNTNKSLITPHAPEPIWTIRSIDTMKYSRDLAREKLTDKTFDKVIDEQTKRIADSGATHIALGTPYDREFTPYLARWVAAARRYGLKIWFRGNMSGWEEWFGYPAIGEEEHTAKVVEFIKSNPELFADGDIFSSCPECENGVLGDPRQTGKVAEYRRFLIKEYQTVNEAFSEINRRVGTSFHSMNYDIAWLIMDPSTTKELGGIVSIDHYVKDENKLASDVTAIALRSGGKVFLGEYGAPIPDIHGKMTESEQALWIEKSLSLLSQLDELIGINYWTSVGGSTQLWQEDGRQREAATIVSKYYQMLK